MTRYLLIVFMFFAPVAFADTCKITTASPSGGSSRQCTVLEAKDRESAAVSFELEKQTARSEEALKEKKQAALDALITEKMTELETKK